MWRTVSHTKSAISKGEPTVGSIAKVTISNNINSKSSILVMQDKDKIL